MIYIYIPLLNGLQMSLPLGTDSAEKFYSFKKSFETFFEKSIDKCSKFVLEKIHESTCLYMSPFQGQGQGQF